jgi:hypothetical protein
MVPSASAIRLDHDRRPNAGAFMAPALRGIDPSGPLQVDAWFRGPVNYDRPLALSDRWDGPATSFALRVEGDPRPAITGNVRS